jgi:hypothetical protein
MFFFFFFTAIFSILEGDQVDQTARSFLRQKFLMKEIMVVVIPNRLRYAMDLSQPGEMMP